MDILRDRRFQLCPRLLARVSRAVDDEKSGHGPQERYPTEDFYRTTPLGMLCNALERLGRHGSAGYRAFRFTFFGQFRFSALTG